MPRKSAASREDLQSELERGIKSQSPGPVKKPSIYDDGLHDNQTSGEGILIRRAPKTGGRRR